MENYLPFHLIFILCLLKGGKIIIKWEKGFCAVTERQWKMSSTGEQNFFFLHLLAVPLTC